MWRSTLPAGHPFHNNVFPWAVRLPSFIKAKSKGDAPLQNKKVQLKFATDGSERRLRAYGKQPSTHRKRSTICMPASTPPSFLSYAYCKWPESLAVLIARSISRFEILPLLFLSTVSTHSSQAIIKTLPLRSGHELSNG